MQLDFLTHSNKYPSPSEQLVNFFIIKLYFFEVKQKRISKFCSNISSLKCTVKNNWNLTKISENPRVLYAV